MDLRLLDRRSLDVRCAWCHAPADPEEVACLACQVIVHLECRAQAGRCPTLGCLRALEGEPDGLSGPYARLVLSGLVHAAVCVGASGAGLLLSGLALAGADRLPGVTIAMLLLWAGGAGWLALQAGGWLRRLPRVLLGVRRALRRGRSAPMVLQVLHVVDDQDRSAFAPSYRVVSLRPPPGEPGPALDVRASPLLTPAWLLATAGREVPVRLYGGAAGPWVVEVGPGCAAVLAP